MCRQIDEKRLHVRFPYRAPASYKVLGNEFNPPREAAAEAEIIDLSDHGAGICLRDLAVNVGALVVLKIPVSETRTTVPTLAQVKWVKEGMPGVSFAGLAFML